MSYSFSITAGTKADAKQKIAVQFDNVIYNQPSHKTDRDAAVACGQAFVGTLAEPHEGDEIYVSMNGSLGWNHDAPDEFLHANVSVNASLRNKSK